MIEPPGSNDNHCNTSLRHNGCSMIVLGKILKTKGLKGEVRIKVFTGDLDLFQRYPAFVINGHRYQINYLKKAGKYLILKLATIDTIDAAKGLQGAYLTLSRKEIIRWHRSSKSSSPVKREDPQNSKDSKDESDPIFIADLIDLAAYYQYNQYNQYNHRIAPNKDSEENPSSHNHFPELQISEPQSPELQTPKLQILDPQPPKAQTEMKNNEHSRNPYSNPQLVGHIIAYYENGGSSENGMLEVTIAEPFRRLLAAEEQKRKTFFLPCDGEYLGVIDLANHYVCLNNLQKLLVFKRPT